MSVRHRFRFAATLPVVVLAGLLAGCTAPSTRVVLLPPNEGTLATAVVVRAQHGELLLSQPYQQATAALGAPGAPELQQLDAAGVRGANRTLFDLLPPRAQHYTVYFATGDSNLTPESEQAMAEALVAALARPGGDIVVTGHTDTRGNLASNDTLSRQRAQQVRQMFLDRGFPASRIEAVGRGERELAVPTPDEVDEPRNRRVTIDVR